MPFAVEFTRRGEKAAKNLPRSVQARIAAKLRDVADDPAGTVQRLRGVKGYKARVGEYRIILDIDWDEEVVYVHWVGLRKQAY